MVRAKSTDLITLDGTGANATITALPTSILRGVYIVLGTAVSVPFTVANMGRTIVGKTITTSAYFPIGELVDTAAGAASTDYGEGGAVVHGDITFTVTGGTAGGTITSVTYLYE